MQYFLLLTLGSILLLALKSRSALFFLPVVALLLFDLHPLYLGGPSGKVVDGGNKIMCINLYSKNRQFKSVKNYINEKNPDLLVLQEFNEFWQSKLEPLLNEYPYRLRVPRSDSFGIAVYSKLKVSDFEVQSFGSANLPSIVGELQIGEKMVRLIATHPLPPVSENYFHHRNQQLKQLANYIRTKSAPAILVGDLNTSSFSENFKTTIELSGLRDSRQGFGLLGTWPGWFTPLMTTLDHFLISDEISVIERSVGPHVGSDHLPIFMEFSLQ
jgi:endonuclease/exonuclease/phosphatase (EEP) superfamily protein YafD